MSADRGHALLLDRGNLKRRNRVNRLVDLSLHRSLRFLRWRCC